MKKKIIYVCSLIIILCYLFTFHDKGEWQSPHPHLLQEKWVAHAGGSINGLLYTNSLEALNHSYQSGLKLIEIDFEWTKDQHLVLLHDWDENLTGVYGVAPGARTLTQFIDLNKSAKLTPLTIHDLFIWLDQHPSATIITDIKSKSVKALAWIAKHYPAYAERFIPQIYAFHEYELVRKLGYYRVILTLYKTHVSDQALIAFCKTHPVWAVTMSKHRVSKSHITSALARINIPVYVHTINEDEKIKAMFDNGVFGIYTDKI